MQTRPPGDPVETIFAELIEDDAIVTLAELCGHCGVPADTIMSLVDHGVLEPQDRNTVQWTFSVISVRRASTALRLHRDLGVNLQGAALALDLLDRVKRLEQRVRDR